MGVAHLHATFLQLMPDSSLVDTEVLADAGEGLAVPVKLPCFVDLRESEAALADLDAFALQDGRDGRWVNPEALGELECLAAIQILTTEVGSFFAGQALGARCWSCYNWAWNRAFSLGSRSRQQLKEPLTSVNMIQVSAH